MTKNIVHSWWNHAVSLKHLKQDQNFSHAEHAEYKLTYFIYHKLDNRNVDICIEYAITILFIKSYVRPLYIIWSCDRKQNCNIYQ